MCVFYLLFIVFNKQEVKENKLVNARVLQVFYTIAVVMIPVKRIYFSGHFISALLPSLEYDRSVLLSETRNRILCE
jgi:hypothetical protein